MSQPTRIQLSRRKGFRLQEVSMALNGLPAVKVARPGKWGNPYRVINDNADEVVARFRRLFEGPPSRFRHMLLGIASGRPGIGEGAILDMKLSLPELRGKNLACFCSLDQPCHGDVLLELSNAPTAKGESDAQP